MSAQEYAPSEGAPTWEDWANRWYAQRDEALTELAAARAALADMVSPARLAEVWEQGWEAGCNDQQYGDENARPWTPNPYRPAAEGAMS